MLPSGVYRSGVGIELKARLNTIKSPRADAGQDQVHTGDINSDAGHAIFGNFDPTERLEDARLTLRKNGRVKE